VSLQPLDLVRKFLRGAKSSAYTLARPVEGRLRFICGGWKFLVFIRNWHGVCTASGQSGSNQGKKKQFYNN